MGSGAAFLNPHVRALRAASDTTPGSKVEAKTGCYARGRPHPSSTYPGRRVLHLRTFWRTCQEVARSWVLQLNRWG